MRVGVYLVGLDPAYAGGWMTYAIGLVNGLMKNSGGHQVVTFFDDQARAQLSDRIASAPGAACVSVATPGGRTLERLTALPGLNILHVPVRNRRMASVAAQIGAQCDVVLFPLCFMGAYRLPIPSIVSFHDLQHESHPEFFTWRALRARRIRFGASFRHATLIQASSEAMKADALRVYGDRISPERIVVIPEGVDYATFSADPGVDPRPTYGLPQEFLLYPAQLWRHKNHLRLLQALDCLRTHEKTVIPLVLTGAEYEAAPNIRRFIAERELGGQVFVLGRVPYIALRALYRQARYVLSASLHESNCLPALEAAASGAPLILADIAPNRESTKVFKARLFDPLDIEDIAATLQEAWKNRHHNQEAVDANREAVRRFDWAAIADMYLECAERLVGSRQGGRERDDAPGHRVVTERYS